MASLKNIDSLDIEYSLKTIEKSLNIKYHASELSKISNLGELCDLTVSKIEAENSETCTNQQAFYKIRDAFSETLNIEKRLIAPKTELSTILPRSKTLQNSNKIEKKLNLKLNLLTSSRLIDLIFIIILIFGIIFSFVNNLGIALILISVLGLKFSKDNGRELRFKTFSDLVKDAVQNNYTKLRRHHHTVNKNEIETIVIGTFSKLLHFSKNELTRKTEF